MKKFPLSIFLRFGILLLLFTLAPLHAETSSSGEAASEGFVARLEMKMFILPGTEGYLAESLKKADEEGAKAVIVQLDTPGGIVQTTMNMIQEIFQSSVPVIVYVGPSGAGAISAGVFLTMAGHVAVMAPGTSIGAAHPVAESGEDIGGDMRKKVENSVASQIKTIAEERGRNAEWVEKAVRESVSLTEKEALKEGVIDYIAKDTGELLSKLVGRKVKVKGGEIVLQDLSKLPVRDYSMSVRNQALNILANPNVAALLWLGATTGITIELYNPGLILPGVVGIICLVLALAVKQLIPLSTGALLLVGVGACLLLLDLFVGSVAMAVGGLVAIALGLLYLVDVTQAPGVAVDPQLIGTLVVVFGGVLFYISREVLRAYSQPEVTGGSGLVGKEARVVEGFSPTGKVFLEGEYWSAEKKDPTEPIEKGQTVRVLEVLPGLVLLISAQENKPE